MTQQKLWAILHSWVQEGLGIIGICVVYVLIAFHIFMYLLVKVLEQINLKEHHTETSWILDPTQRFKSFYHLACILLWVFGV